MDRSELAARVDAVWMLFAVAVEGEAQGVVAVPLGEDQLPRVALEIAQALLQADRQRMAVADAGLQLRQCVAEAQ